ncbi:MAG TPA: glycosyltransferase, partial [Thermoanaerobaculia bacterium]|nr:glycosyltransferase [Thermoanaerobaculia bacterium]
MTLSVCIATHERSRLLAATLEALSRQSRPPDEIVVSDSSDSGDARNVVAAFSTRHPGLSIRHVPSSRKALPWQRWWAFKHSGGAVILFLDDDVTLSSLAVEALERLYTDCKANPKTRIAGAGFWIAFEDGTRTDRRPGSLKERWLGTSRLPSGSIT